MHKLVDTEEDKVYKEKVAELRFCFGRAVSNYFRASAAVCSQEEKADFLKRLLDKYSFRDRIRVDIYLLISLLVLAFCIYKEMSIPVSIVTTICASIAWFLWELLLYSFAQTDEFRIPRTIRLLKRHGLSDEQIIKLL